MIIIMVVCTPFYMCWGVLDHNDSNLIAMRYHVHVDALFWGEYP